MHTYEVQTIMGTFYIPADDYSRSPDGTRLLFWVGNKIVRSFLVDELIGGDVGTAVTMTK